MNSTNNKTIRVREAAKELGITVNQLRTFISNAIPKRLIPRKTLHRASGQLAYEFAYQDLEVFKRAIQLKENLTYSKVRDTLEEELLQGGSDMSLQHLQDFFSGDEEVAVIELPTKEEVLPSIDLINLENKEGQLLVSSREIAENFEKEHRNVLRDIDNRILSLLTSAQNCSHLFIENYYKDSYKRNQREYLLTRDGFSFIVMGFTGQKADVWKLKYIEAFNKMEDKLKKVQLSQSSYMIQDPIERARAWIKEQQEKEQLQLTTTMQKQIIGELQPKADYTDTILKSDDLLTITQIAKDYGLSGQAMNNLLHELGVQYKESGQWLLYREHDGKGYTQSQTVEYKKANDSVGTTLYTKWKQKGRLFLYELLKENDVLPNIEKQ